MTKCADSANRRGLSRRQLAGMPFLAFPLTAQAVNQCPSAALHAQMIEAQTAYLDAVEGYELAAKRFVIVPTISGETIHAYSEDQIDSAISEQRHDQIFYRCEWPKRKYPKELIAAARAYDPDVSALKKQLRSNLKRSDAAYQTERVAELEAEYSARRREFLDTPATTIDGIFLKLSEDIEEDLHGSPTLEAAVRDLVRLRRAN